MVNSQLYPLEVNPRTEEPFLRLKKHKSIILTPPRISDAEPILPFMNDPQICEWLGGPPYPYFLGHAQTWLAAIVEESDGILKELDAASDTESPVVVGGCPVRAIREVRPDGKEIFLGDIGIRRCTYGELLGSEDGVDWERKTEYEQNNDRLAIGDPNIVWSIGDYLAPSHHRQGIMTDAVSTLISEWAVPRMSVKKILVSAFIGNEGSVKVFERNGFTLTRTVANYREHLGKTRGIHVMEWHLEDV